MASVFVHFEPIAPLTTEDHAFEAERPPYVLPNSPEDINWKQHNPDGWKSQILKHLTEGTTEVHQLVNTRELDRLKEFLDMHPHQVNAKDKLGWTPLHEAVRTMRGDIVRLLVQRGANVHAETNDGRSALALAYYFIQSEDVKYGSHPQDHPVVRYLESLGAKKIWDGEEL